MWLVVPFFLWDSPLKTHLCSSIISIIFSYLWHLLFKHWLIQGSPVILLSYLCNLPFNRASSRLYFISNRFWKVWSTCIEIFRNLRMTGQPKGDQAVCPSAPQTEAAYPPLHVSARYTIHCTENPIYVFPEMKLGGLVPNSYIHLSVKDLYITRIGLPIKSLTDTWMWK